MRFAVLGPVEVETDGGPVALRPGRQRALLCALLCGPGVVSDGELLAAVWHVEPTADAVRTLQVCVHRLRHALGEPDRIVRRGGGYALVVEPGELDAARFEQFARTGRALLAAGDPAAAARAFADALALWRGDPFAGEADCDLVRDEASRLAERRLAVVEWRIDADLALGRATDVVPELAELTRQHPLRERFHAQYMSALRSAGRRADALTAFRRARAVTVTELGLEPAAELRALHDSILSEAGSAPDIAEIRLLAAQGDHARAIPAARSALGADAPERGELHELAGVCLREQGDLTAAADHIGAALALAVSSADAAAEARAVQFLSIIERERGDYAAADRLLARASGLQRETGDDERLACLLLSGGDLYLHTRDRRARDAIGDGMALCADLHIPFGTAYATRLAGEAELAAGRARRALPLLRRAVALTESAGSPFSLAITLRSMGIAHASLGHAQDARTAWQRAEGLYGRIGNPRARRKLRALRTD
ncbi:AfsR/SARP family transcriptional regulator [Actinokineospora fastidiosa]|uniref:Uncharacterized protein n=1 Tax=Actinokineospora fastidiosa TaxID=1816 RepID=A0A918GSA1_9PSEU|nr:AfsR/SARP family transcriptional regulator [Actinokineospora fastidiosa]GGS54500.1 hypothetical protein GCM10010171_57060 [Actinokineospora fastidiosa]